MRGFRTAAMAMAATALLAGPAAAAVSFKFERIDGREAFEAHLPDFPSTNVTIPLDQLDSCYVFFSFMGASCDPPSLEPDTDDLVLDIVRFATDAGDGDHITKAYYFADGALSVLGVHETVLGTQARLTVALVPVPEPTTWAMMLTGFGLLGGALRRRRARAA